MMVLDSKNINVLVVDDDEINRQMATMILTKKLPYKVLTADNGMRAIEIMAQYDINLVLLDIDMPVWDGFKTLEVIRSEKRWKKIPVMMLTAAADLATVVRANDFKVSDYVRKPFMPDELADRVAKVVWDNWNTQGIGEKTVAQPQEPRNISQYEGETPFVKGSYYSDLFN